MGGDYTLRAQWYQGFYGKLIWLNTASNYEKKKDKGNKMSGEPLHITDESFEKIVMQSNLPVIVGNNKGGQDENMQLHIHREPLHAGDGASSDTPAEGQSVTQPRSH